MLANVNEFVLFAAAGAAFYLAVEMGFRLGSRRRARSAEGGMDHIKALQSALLGLLSLLLGFNFAMASSRFDTRKALITEEVNTIGTAWLRVQLLPSPARQEFYALLRRYVDARLDYIQAGTDVLKLRSADAEASVLEAQLWKATAIMVEQNTGGPQAGLLIQSLNETVNVKWKRSAVLDNHIPEPVLYLLFIVALGALGMMGYTCGLTGRRHYVSTSIYAGLIALVLATILDFDRPRGGFIRVGEEGMARLQTAFGHHPLPP